MEFAASKSVLIVNAEKGTIDRRMMSGAIRQNIGSLDGHGYLQFRHNNQSMSVHRFIWESVHGAAPPKMLVDHINGDPTDNRIENLRLVTRSQNGQNQHCAQRRNALGVKGVCWSTKLGKFNAQIRAAGKVKNLGYFESVEQASAAYCAAAHSMHTHNPFGVAF